MVKRNASRYAIRRKLRAALTYALVAFFVVSLAVVGVTVTPPVANAFIPTPVDELKQENGDNASPDQPVITGELTHSKINGRDPRKGETFTYTGHLDFTNISEPVESRTVRIYVPKPGNATWLSPLSARDLRLPAGATATGPHNSSANDEINAQYFEVTGLQEHARVEFSKQARVDQDAADAAFVTQELRATVHATPNVALTKEGPTFTPDSPSFAGKSCSGTLTFTWKAEKSGGWLMDLQFADAEGQGKLYFDSAQKLVNGAQNPNATDSITITAADGRDLTADLLGKGSYAASQPTPPYYGDADPIVKSHRSAKWLDAYNWKYDTAAFYGNAWLPHGATVTVKRHVQYRNCFGAGFAGDFDVNRAAIAVLEMGRAVADGKGGASDEFVLPGERQTHAACEGIYLTSKDVMRPYVYPLALITDKQIEKENADGTVPRVDMLAYSGRNVVNNNHQRNGYGLSVTNYKDDKVDLSRRVYVDHAAERNDSHPGPATLQVGYYDLDEIAKSHSQEQNIHYVSSDAHPLPNAPIVGRSRDWSSHGSAIDKNGIFWVIFGQKRRVSHEVLYSLDLKNPSEGFKTHGLVQIPKYPPSDGLIDGILSRTIPYEMNLDMAVDSNGDLLLIPLYHKGGTIGAKPNSQYIYRIKHDDYIDEGSASRPIPISNDGSINDVLGLSYLGPKDYADGMAFGPEKDPHLYLSTHAGYIFRTTLPYSAYANQKAPITASLFNYNYTGLLHGDTGLMNYLNDLASCNAGSKQERPGGGSSFVVNKAPVDPVTGVTLPAGTSSENPAELLPDGPGYVKTTVEYVIRVANASATPGDPGAITDTFTAPRGFETKSIELVNPDGTSRKVNNNYRIQPGRLNAVGKDGYMKSYRVKVTLRAPLNLFRADWSKASECRTQGDGTPGYGLFNAVRMGTDSDPARNANNDACIPVSPPPTGTITLRKQIVDADGYEVPGPQFDAIAKDFQLTAGGALGGEHAGMPVTPVTGVTGEVERVQVLAGRDYSLSEQGKTELSAGYRPYGPWQCTGVRYENGSFHLGDGDNAVCVIKNVNPRTFVQKFPLVADGADNTLQAGNEHNNPHWGEAKVINPNSADHGAFYYEYVVRVGTRAPAGLMINSEAVYDHFVVPAGLAWDGDKPAEITYDRDWAVEHGNADAMPVGFTRDHLTKQVTREQLSGTYLITPSVQHIEVNNDSDREGPVQFKVRIPLVPDMRRDDPNFFDRHLADLGTCQLSADHGQGVGVVRGKGVVNDTVMPYEDSQPGLSNPDIDNHACIPVTTGPSWKIEKQAILNQDDVSTNPRIPSAQDDSAWGPIGYKEEVTIDSSQVQFTRPYRIVVTNDGRTTGRVPDVVDTPAIPEGFTLTSFHVVGRNTQNIVASLHDGTLRIPSSGENLAPGQKKIYNVLLQYVAYHPDRIDWEKLGECRANGRAIDPHFGLLNTTNFGPDTTDSDGPENNTACYPIVPREHGIIVKKYGRAENGQTPKELPGAEFALYADNNGQMGQRPLEMLTRDPNNGALFSSQNLHYGQYYWLAEMKAPSADRSYSLLARPLRFQFTVNGLKPSPTNAEGSSFKTKKNLVVQTNTESGPRFSVDGGSYVIQDFTVSVYDNPNIELPETGGSGTPWRLSLVGLLIVALAGGLALRRKA